MSTWACVKILVRSPLTTFWNYVLIRAMCSFGTALHQRCCGRAHQIKMREAVWKAESTAVSSQGLPRQAEELHKDALQIVLKGLLRQAQVSIRPLLPGLEAGQASPAVIKK